MLKFFYHTIQSTAIAQAMIEAYKIYTQHPNDISLLIQVSDKMPKETQLTSEFLTGRNPQITFFPYALGEDGEYRVTSIFDAIKPWIDVDKPKSELPSKVTLIVTGAHNLAPVQVDQLRYIADLDATSLLTTKKPRYKVFCYGLRTNTTTRLFPGSQKLMEIADYIDCVTTNCSCGRIAIFNYITSTEEPLCSSCYYDRIMNQPEDSTGLRNFFRIAREDSEKCRNFIQENIDPDPDK